MKNDDKTKVKDQEAEEVEEEIVEKDLPADRQGKNAEKEENEEIEKLKQKAEECENSYKRALADYQNLISKIQNKKKKKSKEIVKKNLF